MPDDVPEREEDLALRLAVAAAREAGTADDRLLDWRAVEARVSLTDAEISVTAADGVRFAARMRQRVAARRARVRRVMEPPSRFDASREGQAAAVPYFALSVAAGVGRSLWDQAPDTHLALPDDLPAGRYLALPVRGRSMEPLLDGGDVVLVNRDLAPRKGRIVVARDEDDGYVVKRFSGVVAGTIELESLNPEFAGCAIPAVPGAILGVVVLAWSGDQRRPAASQAGVDGLTTRARTDR